LRNKGEKKSDPQPNKKINRRVECPNPTKKRSDPSKNPDNPQGSMSNVAAVSQIRRAFGWFEKNRGATPRGRGKNNEIKSL